MLADCEVARKDAYAVGRYRTLTWDDLRAECSRTAGHGQEQTLNVWITPPVSERAVQATVVPTRMHDPGFYVRSRNDMPLWTHWMLRSDEDLAMFRRFVDQGRVTAAVSGQTPTLCDKYAVSHEPDPTGWCPVCETQVFVADPETEQVQP